MPEIDLSSQIPASATWIKIHYVMHPLKPAAQLVARIWSGDIKEAVVINGESGDVFVKLTKPQHVSYQRPVTVDLTLKVVAYKAVAE